MLNERQIERILEKQRQFANRMEEYLFDEVDDLDIYGFETFDKLDSPPQPNSLYRKMKAGDTWGENKKYCWFRAEYTVPSHLLGKDLYLWPEYDGYEALLFVNGVPYTNYAAKILSGSHGNHYCKVFLHRAEPGTTVRLDLEAYAGHHGAACAPYEEWSMRTFPKVVGRFRVCVRNELFTQFYYDYQTLRELYDALEDRDFKRAQIEICLLQMHEVLPCADREVTKEELQNSIAKAIDNMTPLLHTPNRNTCRGTVGVIGHSHMDTAWLWEIDETVKKCARTFSNQLSLMERYEDYRFIQSSSYHLRLMEIHYPQLFQKISSRIREGRYEPNGGSWIECDCNITGGEFLIRQFLWGQNYTQKHFGYLSNAFFLPDTFGYSAAIPQILKGVKISYFLTTKLSWNDTNRFPYDTYYWEGIDGSRVFVHHNVTHCGPSPKTAIQILNDLSQKNVSEQRLLTYGLGDGGGGPEDGMPEIVERMKDMEGCPKVYSTTVGEFMEDLERTANQPNVYRGELYLELHRGTLTSMHTIKRNNRKAEFAIRNAEYLTVVNAVQRGIAADASAIAPYVETLMVNQFHDILPGTSIEEVNIRSIRETTALLHDVETMIHDLLSDPTPASVTLTNTLSFERDDAVGIPTKQYLQADCHQQRVKLFDGTQILRISGLHMSGLESRSFALTEQHTANPSPFRFESGVLKTPFAVVSFDEKGGIASFYDRRAERELRGNGLPLNTFLFGEDFPLAWDDWDIDIDIERKLKPCTDLLRFEVAADGEVEFRIRTEYRLSPHSTLKQDMIFYADSPRVDFETCVDWNDKHRLLKVAFDVSVRSDYVTQEIQYGNIKRTTKRNTSTEQAAFEVCNHKYTDISEPGYGIAILNDCKYGISVNGSTLALTLHKGGCNPDVRGDVGVHGFTYSFLPHEGGFAADTTIRQGYLLNCPMLVSEGSKAIQKLLSVDKSNIVVEVIKPCEESEKAFIARLYEAEGTYTNTTLLTDMKISSMKICDMLENEQEDTDGNLSFCPFEIKTLKLSY